MAEKCINCTSARPIPPHTNPMVSGLGNTFSAHNRKKTKRFLSFDSKKGAVIFLDIFDPPTPLPQNLKKVGFKWGGFGGIPTKNSLGYAFVGQNNDFTRG